MKKDLKSKHFTLEKVRDGIYAAIAKDGGGAAGNAGFIDLGDQTIIFDTFNTPQAALDLKNMAEDLTNHAIAWVVNSHHHGDHIRGNQVFSSSHILSSEATFTKMKENHPARIEKQKQDLAGLGNHIKALKQQFEETKDERLKSEISFLEEIEISLPGLQLTLPRFAFKESFTIYGSKRTAKIYTMGSAHSYCDSFLYIPEDRVIFTGDLLVKDTHPALFEESDSENWVRILNQFEMWDIDAAVPGHGPVGSRSDFQLIRQYLEDIREIAGNTESIESIEIPLAYRHWSFSSLFSNNLRNLKAFVKN
ncbi:MBL fold metallo-hydrolase [Fictibacillus barbaricus]|uniref:Glyoxylase-like metal-dependent hydrolase (Beta-lactamase superfamily II) n=1 Tax=Fictibacillus barbaricus TaxID=182136 RepID=A0ABU1TX62_9BACL|nr:MBL fold metallo-hydrolase [Fictibacillus barbaricus]MDR7071750.1 glyoxylase-like metal-dependent hydrolase (beta-lactamase superfamily II) [Fictibacillus barbaricus]